MGNEMTTPLPTVEEIQAKISSMEQNAVLAAVDIGTDLRRWWTVMDQKSFLAWTTENFKHNEKWINTLLWLSWYADDVRARIAAGSTLGIEAMYKKVKKLPAPPVYTEEKAQRPKAQRGPKKGSGNAGRPKGNAAPKDEPKSNPKHLGWSAAVQQDYRRLYDEVDFPEGFGRNNLTQQPSIRERVFATAGVEYSKRMPLIPGSDESTALATAVYQCWAEDNPAPKQETQQQKETLSQRKQREFDQLVQKEIGRIRAAGNNELRKEMEKLKAQWQVKIDAATDRELQKLAEFRRARQIREGMTAIMPNEEFDKLIRLLHPDRYPEEYRSKVDQAVQILRRYVSPCLNREPKPIPRGHNPFRENANV